MRTTAAHRDAKCSSMRSSSTSVLSGTALMATTVERTSDACPCCTSQSSVLAAARASLAGQPEDPPRPGPRRLDAADELAPGRLGPARSGVDDAPRQRVDGAAPAPLRAAGPRAQHGLLGEDRGRAGERWSPCRED